MTGIAAQTPAEFQFRPNDTDPTRTQKLELLRRAFVLFDGQQTLNLSIVDLPTADSAEPLFRHRVRDTSWTFLNGLADSSIAASGTPAIRLRKNGVQVGTITFTGTTGVVSFSNPAFANGDLFEIYPPAAADPTLDQLSVTLTVAIV